MKKLFLFIVVIFLFSSCTVRYQLNYQPSNLTKVVLSGANYKYLGSFSGTVSEKKTKVSIRDMEGMLSRAKTNLYNKARAAGIKMEGSVALVNISTDMVENYRLVTITVSGDIVEFTK